MIKPFFLTKENFDGINIFTSVICLVIVFLMVDFYFSSHLEKKLEIIESKTGHQTVTYLKHRYNVRSTSVPAYYLKEKEGNWLQVSKEMLEQFEHGGEAYMGRNKFNERPMYLKVTDGQFTEKFYYAGIKKMNGYELFFLLFLFPLPFIRLFRGSSKEKDMKIIVLSVLVFDIFFILSYFLGY